MLDQNLIAVIIFFGFLVAVIVLVKDDNDLAREATKGLVETITRILARLT